LHRTALRSDLPLPARRPRREGRGGECLPEAVRAAAVCSQDKAVDVREASTALMSTLLEVGDAQQGRAGQGGSPPS
jgi:hypothetical protein